MNVIKQIIKAPYKSNSIVRVKSYKHTKREKDVVLSSGTMSITLTQLLICIYNTTVHLNKNNNALDVAKTVGSMRH